jgi:hypothetical protein
MFRQKTLDPAKIGEPGFSEGHGLSSLPRFDRSGRIFRFAGHAWKIRSIMAPRRAGLALLSAAPIC